MTQQRERLIGYIRVSTEGQADGGVSLDAQRQKLAAYAVALDVELVRIVEDAGYSAKSLARPGLRAALRDLEEGRATGLLVAKLDRLTRSVRDLGALVDEYFSTRFALVSVADAIDTRTAAGRLVMNVLGAVSQWEREATVERTKEALAHLRDEGIALGAPPLGWDRIDERDGAGRLRIAPNLEELSTIERVRALRDDGLSLRAIAAVLTAEGRRTKRGGRWRAVTVQRALRKSTPSIASVASEHQRSIEARPKLHLGTNEFRPSAVVEPVAVDDLADDRRIGAERAR
ncbi:MAG: recombinase family protein [Labilithrix sp.]|nr:recombinase family protein [Labilithrix sp.]MCW5811537.1 recombinase family protein [Labilithrix sp.]